MSAVHDFHRPKRLKRLLRQGISLGLVAGLVACGPAALPPGDTIVDRDEAQNRDVHEFNVAVDRAVLRPTATAYGTIVPRPVRQGVSNFASNLNQPAYVMNDLLQLQLEDAFANTFRFVINSTIGIGGLLDPASAIGIPARETGFGETLHVYGVPEGDFVMLPVLGPSTTRDTLGDILDYASNPVRVLVDTPEIDYVRGANVADTLNSRHEFAGSIDSVLDESVDSYAALRSLYLQNRRFELRGADAALTDPAADPTLDPLYDPLTDPYFDPYAQ